MANENRKYPPFGKKRPSCSAGRVPGRRLACGEVLQPNEIASLMQNVGGLIRARLPFRSWVKVGQTCCRCTERPTNLPVRATHARYPTLRDYFTIYRKIVWTILRCYS